MPNVTVAAPASGKELEEMLAVAVSMYEEASIIPKGCFAIRYPAKERLPRDKADDAIRSPVEYGKGEICFDSRKNGMKTADVCIISIGEMLYEALKAAERLSGSGYGVIVFNARFYRPLDRDGILKYVLDSRCVITVEEAVKAGGFGESVEILLAENEVFKPCKVIALPDKAVEHGKISEIQRLYGLDADGIVACSERLIRKLHIETCKDDL